MKSGNASLPRLNAAQLSSVLPACIERYIANANAALWDVKAQDVEISIKDGRTYKQKDNDDKDARVREIVAKRLYANFGNAQINQNLGSKAKAGLSRP